MPEDARNSSAGAENLSTKAPHTEKKPFGKFLDRVKKQSTLLKGEVDKLDKDLLFHRDTYIRELLAKKSFIDIDVKRIFRVVNG